jgi:hypothetical protein
LWLYHIWQHSAPKLRGGCGQRPIERSRRAGILIFHSFRSIWPPLRPPSSAHTGKILERTGASPGCRRADNTTLEESWQALKAPPVAMLRAHIGKLPSSSSLPPIQEETADEKRRFMADELQHPLLDVSASEEPGQDQPAMRPTYVVSQQGTEYQNRELEGTQSTAT